MEGDPSTRGIQALFSFIAYMFVSFFFVLFL